MLPRRLYIYTVQRNETLAAIASKYNTSTKKIAKANSISRKHRLRAGTKLRIPLSGGSGVAAEASKAMVHPGLNTGEKRRYTLADSQEIQY